MDKKSLIAQFTFLIAGSVAAKLIWQKLETGKWLWEQHELSDKKKKKDDDDVDLSYTGGKKFRKFAPDRLPPKECICRPPRNEEELRASWYRPQVSPAGAAIHRINI